MEEKENQRVSEIIKAAVGADSLQRHPGQPHPLSAAPSLVTRDVIVDGEETKYLGKTPAYINASYISVTAKECTFEVQTVSSAGFALNIPS